MKIRGTITFQRELGILPLDSCLKVRVEDVSMMDVSSFLVKEQTFNMSLVEVRKTLTFNYTSPKPIEDDLHDQYAISANLHLGWCPENGLRERDWMTDTMFYVELENKTDSYESEFYLKG